ncbi:MAG: hypothetical protein IKF78_03980 [Atopobiaceae bacterium]|nr:hypothetical protein [Atopobiaceae bacterium]
MAVYSKLLLSAGGGIVSLQQQADQEPNAANLLIGLGGTGVDCLRTIKTQVHSRLKPDDPDAIVPTYDHIRFLGVDTDQKSRGISGSEEEGRADSLLALSDTEYFSIANGHVKRDLSNKLALADLRELNWLRYEDIKAGDLTVAGAGGIRQVGRYMLMTKSNRFANRIEQEINAAKSGLTNPTVYVHIFSGLSGGTGSGTFLDVCYIVRHIAQKVGNVTIFGYFFLPDVNLSRIPYSNGKVRAYIPRNGYAAMQELDYCMQLKENGGAFVQNYQGTQIEWDTMPVDLCHLVCATDTNNNVVPKAYEYAMNVTAEYVMDFLTKSEGFTMESQLSNFTNCVNMGDGTKRYGVNLNYCVIGAACASLPLREVNTYLASELFGKFSGVGKNLPTKRDIEVFAMASLGNSREGDISQLYNRLTTEMQQGFDFMFEDWGDDFKLALSDGSAGMVRHYAGLAANKKGIAEKNALSMQSEDNENSLINRIRNAMVDIIRNVELGPIFAHGMLSAAMSHNMLNIVDGLITENQRSWDTENYNDDVFRQNYENAKNTFHSRIKRGFMDNDRKRFEDYKKEFNAWEIHLLALDCYAMMDKTLRVLKSQIEDVDARYYARLARVTSNLIDTFKENADVLASERQATVEDAFAMPLMSIDELKASMDTQIANVSVPGMFSALMGALLADDAEWLQEDENRICRAVTKFFVETAFGEFASRSITSFLKDKYDTDNNEELTNRVYSDWMVKLKERARPLFHFNGTVWSEDQASTMAFLSVPDTSEPVRKAAERLNAVDEDYKIKVSALTDRIYVMSCSAALPLSAYNNCNEYENSYFEVTPVPGTHFYEGKPIPGMVFDDWRKLPPLTPQSLVRLDMVPHQVRENVMAARELFDRAEAAGLFDSTRRILKPTDESLEALRNAVATCEQLVGQLQRPNQIADAQQALSALDAASNLQMEYSGSSFMDDGPTDPEVKRRMFVDHFVYAPAYQILVSQILDQIDEVRNAAAAAKKALEDRIQAVGVGNQDAADFCEALFTGVISYGGRLVIYHRIEHGITTDITLSKFGPEFPYGRIPIYQAFLNYKELDPADKAAIKKKVEDLYNADSPQIIETGTTLKGNIDENRINAWAQIANTFPESAEILEFVGTFNDKFRLFCMENGI